MGTLCSINDDVTLRLAPRVLIGRAGHSDLRISNPRVSGQHAEIRWSVSAGWVIKDLGSRNGTQLDGKTVPPGEWRPLSAGTRVAFGHSEVSWRLGDTSPPALPAAVPAGGGEVIEAEGGILLLPTPEQPLACVQSSRDRWVLERDDEILPVQDEQVVVVSGRPYRLFLPRGVSTTVEADDRLHLGLLALEFTVSRDEEHVHLVARHNTDTIDLDVRAHHYTLLVLARRRLQDRDAGAGPSEEGWVDREELMRMLAVDRNRLNLDIFRARRQLAAAGLVDAAAIIERRRGSQQLRLGARALSVTRA